MQTIEYVGIQEIAKLANLTKQNISNWQKRNLGFPKPVAILKCGQIFNKAEIIIWLKNTNRI